MDLIDKEVQRKLALSDLFSGQGIKILEEEMESFLATEECAIDGLSRNFINAERLGELNFRLGKAKAFKDFFALKENLLEELKENKDNSPEEQAALNFTPKEQEK